LNQTAVTLDVGNQFTFVANVTGTANTAVSWAIQEGTSGGSITSSGVYTAPGTDGVFHVIATSQADTTQRQTATVTVATLVVSVSPPSNVLGPQGVRTFSASVNTSLNGNVIWSVQEAVGGAITAGGTYTAPSTTGSFHVVATSVQDPSKNAIAAVTIVPSGFRPTGNMSTGRSAHTATLLPNGKVLIAGGDLCMFDQYYGDCPLDSAELYDPGSGTFAATGSMSLKRVFHTATLLTNGKVLVTGGNDASAELYDLTSGTFAATGSMSVGRNSHTATLLASGKILIAGGHNVSGTLATAELYDPNSGTFTATGTMAAARTSHTATLLANGKVLVAGGSSTGELATAELYDPATGNFTATNNSMVSPRTFHTATRLSNGNVLVTGGSLNKALLSSAEVYDAIAGSFSATGPMMTARDSHFAVLLANGVVLVAGGSFGSTGAFTAELYNTGSGTFTQTGGLETIRALAAAVLLPDGRVFVSGGSDTNSAELYK
jgi:WD40 repeat protein